MQIWFNRGLTTTVIVVSAIVLSQCSRSPMSTPTSPGPTAPTTSHLVGDLTNSTPEAGKIKVCKTGNTPNGTFTVSTTGTNTVVTSPYVVTSGECRVVAEATDLTGGNVTVTETSAFFQSVSAMSLGGPVAFTNGGSLFLNAIHGFTLTFTNFEQPPPPPGNQGCTPGFWKQEHHLDSWTTYVPGADFDATFGVNFFNPNITLLQAVGLGGGGVNALARHAVAALLNAASPDVDYTYTVAQVLDIVQGDGAFTGLSVEARKNLLEAANELGCPLS